MIWDALKKKNCPYLSMDEAANVIHSLAAYSACVFGAAHVPHRLSHLNRWEGYDYVLYDPIYVSYFFGAMIFFAKL